jgi:hypothetical protein
MSSVVISIHECYKLSHVDNTFNEYKSNDLDKKKEKWFVVALRQQNINYQVCYDE